MDFVSFIDDSFEQISVAVLIILWLIQLWFYLFRYNGILKYSKKQDGISSGNVNEKLPVSVIICSRNQADNLRKNLKLILEQKYNEFQVVVVNDASIDETEDVLTSLEQTYPNLYHTFVPKGVQNVSSRKMAMTIGIKAAKYEHLIFTDPDCIPESEYWIESLMSNFDVNCGLVLGYSHYIDSKGLLKKMVSFDNMFTAIQFMGIALSGKAFMGFSTNMAYRKDLFFRNKGFASHLNLNSGDDDLFIGEISDKNNTRIAVNPNSIISVEKDSVWGSWKNKVKSHFATSGYYSNGTKLRLNLEIGSRCLFYPSVIAAIIVFSICANYLIVSISAFLLLSRFLIQLMIINKTAVKLNENRFFVTLILFDLILPFIKFFFKVFHIKEKKNDFTIRYVR